MLKNDEAARTEDADNLASRLDSLEKNQMDLRQVLGEWTLILPRRAHQIPKTSTKTT
jgi:ribosomal protein L29